VGFKASAARSAAKNTAQRKPLGQAEGAAIPPPLSSPDYERVSKIFQRLQTLLRVLVPLPGKPFKKSSGAFVPIFQIRIHAKLRGGSWE
jgi:hypothetical protein